MSNKRMSRSEFMTTLAEKSGLNQKQASSALDAINTIITEQLGNQGPGEILIPGLLSLNVIHRPATLQYEGVNPFTKEPRTYKAKPACRVIKVRPLKALQDAV